MKNTISIRIDKTLYKHLCEIAKKEGKKISWLVNKAAENYLISKKVVASETSQN